MRASATAPTSSGTNSLGVGAPSRSWKPTRPNGERVSNSGGAPSVIWSSTPARSLSVGQAVLLGRLGRADDDVLVLGRRRREHLEAVGQRLAQRGDLLVDVGGLGHGVRVVLAEHERQQRVRVLGDEVDLAALDGAEVDLAGADAELVADVEAGGGQRLAVDLGQQLALGEVGRADGDRPAAGDRRRGVARPASVAAGSLPRGGAVAGASCRRRPSSAVVVPAGADPASLSTVVASVSRVVVVVAARGGDERAVAPGRAGWFGACSRCDLLGVSRGP